MFGTGFVQMCVWVTSWQLTGLNGSTHNPAANLCSQHHVNAMSRRMPSPSVFTGGGLNASCVRRPLFPWWRYSICSSTRWICTRLWQDKCLAWRGTRKFEWRHGNVRFKTSTGRSVAFCTRWFSWKTQIFLQEMNSRRSNNTSWTHSD